MQKSITEQINEIIEYLHLNRDSLDPVQCSQKLVELSVLKSSLDSEQATAEIDYNVMFDKMVSEFDDIAYNKLQVKAKATPEYAKLRRMDAASKSVIEIARSIKRFQNSVRDSQQLANNF